METYCLYSPQFTSASYDDMTKNGQIKTWSKEYFTWVGHSELDTVVWNGAMRLNGVNIKWQSI